MADENPETTDAPQADVTPEVAPEAAGEQVEATDVAPEEQPVAEVAPEAAPEAAPAAPPATPLTPKERKVAARARRGARRGATPEERAEIRKAKAAERSRYRAKRREKDRAKRGEPGPAKTPSPASASTGSPKERQGTVVSNKADKTITVRIDTARRHRRYQKIVRSSSTLHAHDETNDAHEGDIVRVIESRPLSATKRWRLIEVLERAK
jgi:small subunit ribosomal protein S17